LANNAPAIPAGYGALNVPANGTAAVKTVEVEAEDMGLPFHFGRSGVPLDRRGQSSGDGAYAME